MEPDYPASHSMDASWFAVDKNGNVASFFTGAGGAVPNRAYSPSALEHYEDLDPEMLEDMDVDVEGMEAIAQQLPDEKRLFHYGTGDMDECLADRYERKKVPKNPLHIDELSPQVRQALSGARFDTIDFSETKVFQPVELTECTTWDPAYLSGDGKTVKPVPGREKEYAEHLETIRDIAEDDGLAVEEPPKKGPAKGKKKGSGGNK